MLKKDGTSVQLDTEGKQKIVDTGAGTILVVNNSKGNKVVINKQGEGPALPEDPADALPDGVDTVEIQERDAQVGTPSNLQLLFGS